MKNLFIIYTLFSLAACNSSDKNETGEVAMLNRELADTTFQMQSPPPPPDPHQERNEEKRKDEPAKINYDWDKKIVKTASLNAEVKNFILFSKSLREKVKKFGGYISNENENSNEYNIQNTVLIKIPVQHFDDAVTAILNDTKTVNEKQISSDDVTTEFVDSKSRLEAKKQVRLKYLELLQRAKNMSEIIEVQKEINDIQEEIEMVNGRINYLSHSSAMSTINFTYQQILNPQPTTGNDGFFTRLKDAFIYGWKWVGELFIGVISIWPLMLLVILIILLLKKKLVLKWNKKAVL